MITQSDLDWYRWHAPYDELVSSQTYRLSVVQDMLGTVFDAAPPGNLKVVSMCSGQARDLLPILISHPRGRDTQTLFVEIDPLNASFLHGALGSTALNNATVLVADAGVSDSYTDFAPAGLVLMGGVLANVSMADASRTVDHLSMLCALGGSVVWSVYGPALPDTDEILALFETSGYERVAVHREDGPDGFTVAQHRRIEPGHELVNGKRFFTFAERA